MEIADLTCLKLSIALSLPRLQSRSWKITIPFYGMFWVLDDLSRYDPEACVVGSDHSAHSCLRVWNGS